MTQESKQLVRKLRALRCPRWMRRSICLMWLVIDRTVRSLWAFAKRHRRCGEALFVAAITAALVSLVPFIGHFVAYAVLTVGIIAGFWAALKVIGRS